jgi:hypothetical protein
MNDLLTCDQELARIRDRMPEMLERYAPQAGVDPVSAPFMFFGMQTKVARLDEATWGDPASWFFIGDLHADFFALRSYLRHAEAATPECRIVFLGDLVDRGDLPLECFCLMLDWAERHPGRLAWIAGNHDLAFRFDPTTNRFVSSVHPAEFLSVLNEPDSLSGFRKRLGFLFMQIAQGLPRAVLFPDGLLATHGGFPLVDLQAQGALAETPEAFEQWLNSPECLKDFTWSRIHRKRRAVPDRHSSDPQYGFLDFEAFCQLKPDWFPVARMVTGHTHPADGSELHATYQVNPALTLLGFGFDDRCDFPQAYAHYRPYLQIGRYVRDGLPEVLPVPVEQGELVMLYPEIAEQALHEPNPNPASDPSEPSTSDDGWA